MKKDVHRFVKLLSHSSLVQKHEETPVSKEKDDSPTQKSNKKNKQSQFDPQLLFKEIFQPTLSEGRTNYHHLLMFQNVLQNIHTAKSGFKVEFYFRQKHWEDRYAIVQEGMLLFYEEKNEYFKNVDLFSEALFLIKIDEIAFQHIDEEYSIVSLSNKSNIFPFLIKIRKKQLTTFLFSVCLGLQQKTSQSIRFEMMPQPSDVLGNFILYFEKTGNILSDQRLKINSGLINIDLDHIGVTKTFILPILNIYDIYEIILGSEFFHLETFSVLQLKNYQKIKLFEFSGFRLSC